MGPLGHVRRAVARRHPLVLKPHWLVVSVALCHLACASDAVLGDYTPSTCDFAEPPSNVSNTLLWVSTFWTADEEEKKALEVLKSDVPSSYNYQDLEMKTRVASQVNLTAAFVEQRLPDVFQANAGSDVLRWVNAREPESSAVCELDRLAVANDWHRAYFPESLAPASCQGHLYALPVGIHKLNVLFFNRELFDQLKQQAATHGQELREPSLLKRPEELLDLLEQVAALAVELGLGEDFVPFALGAQDEWPLTVIAFENVLLGLGQGAYQTLWRGGLANADPQLRKDLTQSLRSMVQYLRRLVELNPADVTVSWQAAIKKVGDGKALFTVTGDWGWAQLDEAQTARVQTVAFPGTAKTFVYTPDSFAVPRELEKNGFPARAFLDGVVANEKTVLNFAHVKHSIPARRDIDVEDLHIPALRAAYQEFKDCSDRTSDCDLLLAVSGLGPPPGSADCFDDIDALLTLAVTGSLPPKDPKAPPRVCDTQLPAGGEPAEKEMIRMLLDIAERSFAAECRPPEE
jgi:glucose/mannose transport system substrate-binding protein